MKHAQILLSIAFLLVSAAHAQTEKLDPKNVVSLSAGASSEVAQDWLAITLSTTEQSPDPQAVHKKLSENTNAAISVIRQEIKADTGNVRMRTRNFSIRPTYSRDGKIASWTGTSEVVIEGRNFPLIGETIGKIKTMNAANTAYSVSPESIASAEAKLNSMAIERFKTVATGIAQDFGFKGFSIREVSVNSGNVSPTLNTPRFAMAKMDTSIASAPMPIEAGISLMQVTVSGTITLQK